MTLGIICIFNVIAGFMLREYIYKRKNQEQTIEHSIFKLFGRFLQVFVVVSYAVHIVFIYRRGIQICFMHAAY